MCATFNYYAFYATMISYLYYIECWLITQDVVKMLIVNHWASPFVTLGQNTWLHLYTHVFYAHVTPVMFQYGGCWRIYAVLHNDYSRNSAFDKCSAKLCWNQWSWRSSLITDRRQHFTNNGNVGTCSKFQSRPQYKSAEIIHFQLFNAPDVWLCIG